VTGVTARRPTVLALLLALVATLALALAAAPSVRAADPDAPRGAEDHWLPDEEWVNNLWLPFDEDRLYRLLGRTRGEVFRWVRVDAHNSLAALGRRRGYSVDRLARALVASRREAVPARTHRVLVRSTARVLRNPHLAQHLLFHALHQVAIPDRATGIFGVRAQIDFLRLRRGEVSPLQIGELFGRTRVGMRRAAADALRDAAALGRRRGYLTAKQAALMLDRQLRQLPRWLGQRRYNGPSGGRNRLRLPDGDQAKHPSLSADGRTLVWDAYRMDVRRAERLGEIHVRGTDLRTGRAFAVSPPVRAGSKRPWSAYNAVVSADGRTSAFETAQSTFPLAKRVGQMSVVARALTGGRRIDRASHLARAKDAPTRTAFNPSLSGDGRLVAFEATDSGTGGAASRNGLFVCDVRGRTETLVAEHDGEGAAYLPRLSADGGALAYTAIEPGGDGRTLVYVRTLADGRTTLVSRAAGAEGAPAASDAYEPSVSADGGVVAFTSRAGNLGWVGSRSRVYVRDVRAGTTTLVSGAVAGDAIEPALSADGRWVAFVARAPFRGGSLDRLRSRVWLHDRTTGRTVLVSRASGARGAASDGYASEPVVSADGGVVAFTSTAGNLDRRGKPGGLAGVFVRDVAAATTRLVSHHGRHPGAKVTDVGGAGDGAEHVDHG